MRRRSVLVLGLGALVGLGQGCGSDVPSVTSGGGSGDGSVDTGAPETGSSGQAGSGDSGDGDSATETSGQGIECLESDLPPPFCHVLLPVSIPYRWAGHLDIVIDEVRPLVIHDEEAETVRLVNPLDPDEVFQEGAASPLLPPDWWAGPAGDFDGDGEVDFTAFDPLAASGVLTDDLSIAVVDGTSFEVLGVIPEASDGGTRGVSAMDVNADGVTEVLTVEYLEDTMEVRAWQPALGDVELVASATGGVDCVALGAFTTDVNGDGLSDLVVVWDGTCAPDFDVHDGINQIATIIAPVSADQPFEVVHTPLPIWPRQAGVIRPTNEAPARLVVVEAVDDIRVLEWGDDGFATVYTLAVPDSYIDADGDITTGVFGIDGGAGILFQGLISPRDIGAAALFVGPAAKGFLPEAPLTQSLWASDFNVDGIDDFVATDGIYLSAVSP